MKLGLLDQFFVLKKMKIVLDTTDSFWGQKWPIFAPKTAILANFGIDKGVPFYTFSISKMDETWPTSSTFKAVKEKNSFGHF